MQSVLGRFGGRDLHLAMARRLWEEDRLREANAAMEQALRAGFHPGDLYDLQRCIEAELGARTAGRIVRIGECALIEADSAAWGDRWADLVAGTRDAVILVGETLGVRWGKPVLVTLVPSDEWVEFVHARYGYYRERAPWHKVCLPPSTAHAPALFVRAVRHEVAHAATHQLVGGDPPRWLDEGVAVLLEGGLQPVERRQYALASAQGRRLSLEEVSARIGGYGLDLGTAEAGLCYAAAADFTERLLRPAGWGGIAQVLRRMGRGEPLDKAIKRALGIDRRRLERDWLAAKG